MRRGRRLQERGVVEFVDPGLDVLPLVREADIGVLMSNEAQHREGCSNAIMEYMSCALPVVCSAGGGNPELVLDAVTGYVVPRGDPARPGAPWPHLVDHPEIAQRSGRGRAAEDPGGLQRPTCSCEHGTSLLGGAFVKICLVDYRYFVSSGPERYMFAVKTLLEARGHEVIPFSVRYRQNDPSPWERYFVPPIAGDDEIVVPAALVVGLGGPPRAWRGRSTRERSTTRCRESCATHGPTWRTS